MSKWSTPQAPLDALREGDAAWILDVSQDSFQHTVLHKGWLAPFPAKQRLFSPMGTDHESQKNQRGRIQPPKWGTLIPAKEIKAAQLSYRGKAS